MSRPRNLNDLIRIEDAIRVLCRKTCHPGIACPDIYCKEMWEEYENVERVEAEPVKQGHWVEDPDDDWGYRCSECGHLEMYQENYCAGCGAKMERHDKGIPNRTLSLKAVVDALDEYILDETTDSHGDTVREILERLAEQTEQHGKVPCDLCVYNPPSSADGKPCSLCMAEGRNNERHDKS